MPTTKERVERKPALGRPEAQVKEMLTTLQHTATDLTDDALRELGRFVIRSQRTPAALTELSGEIRKRKAQLKT